MHILELPTFFPPYGGLFCLNQAKALRQAGHEVRIVSSVLISGRVTPRAFFTYPLKPVWHEMDGIQVLSDYPRSLPGLYRRNIRHWLDSVMRLCEIYVETYGVPDVIHAHVTHWAGVAAMMLKEKYGVPYVITEHCSMTNLNAQHITPDSWQAGEGCKALDNALAVIHVSKENMENISSVLHMTTPCHILSNIIDTDFFQPADQQPKREPFIFSCVGVMLQGKGYDVLLKAFRIACQRSNIPMQLHIAGSGTDGKTMRRMLTENIKDKVILYGNIDREGVRRLLHTSHCFVLATRSESQSLAIMEALSCGLPYISTEAIPQCLRLKGSATIIPIDDIEALAEAMIHAVKPCEPDIATMHQRHAFINDIASSEKFASMFNNIIAVLQQK